MTENKKAIIIASIIISLGIILHGYISNNDNSTLASATNKSVFTLKEVAEYLSMSESEVKAIIIIEAKRLREFGSFSGVMFPYFIIDDNYYFYKDGIDSWLEDVTTDKREYNTKEFKMIK